MEDHGGAIVVSSYRRDTRGKCVWADNINQVVQPRPIYIFQKTYSNELSLVDLFFYLIQKTNFTISSVITLDPFGL